MHTENDWRRLQRDDVEGIEINDFVRISCNFARRGWKGRRLKQELPDLLHEALAEAWEALPEEERAAFDGTVLSCKFCVDVSIRFRRIQGREYARLARRGRGHPLPETELPDPPGRGGEHPRDKSRRERLLEALERLSEESQEVLLATLEAGHLDPRRSEVHHVRQVLGISRTTYYSRLQRAIGELKRQLEWIEGL